MGRNQIQKISPDILLGGDRNDPHSLRPVNMSQSFVQDLATPHGRWVQLLEILSLAISVDLSFSFVRRNRAANWMVILLERAAFFLFLWINGPLLFLLLSVVRRSFSGKNRRLIAENNKKN